MTIIFSSLQESKARMLNFLQILQDIVTEGCFINLFHDFIIILKLFCITISFLYKKNLVINFILMSFKMSLIVYYLIFSAC